MTRVPLAVLAARAAAGAPPLTDQQRQRLALALPPPTRTASPAPVQQAA